MLQIYQNQLDVEVNYNVGAAEIFQQRTPYILLVILPAIWTSLEANKKTAIALHSHVIGEHTAVGIGRD